jgi:hypothetical protein
MGTYTGTPLNIYKPTNSETGWGTLVSTNFQTINDYLKSFGNSKIIESDSSGILTGAAKNTAYNKSFGVSVGDIPEIGTALSASQIVETDASGKLKTAAKSTGYNLALGTTAGTVAEGNHTHDGRYYTETEIDVKLSTLVDVSSETISSAPFSVRATVTGAILDFNQYTSGAIDLVGYYYFKYGFGTTEPASLDSTGHIFGAGSYLIEGTGDDENMYIQVKFVNVMNGTETAYSDTFTVAYTYFGNIDVPSIVEELLKSANFLSSVNSELSGNPATATKIAAAQRSSLSGSGSPSGVITPSFVGQEYLDTTATKWYKATGTANTNWVALN